MIFDLNEEQIFSALDIPPSMAGRSYSTTETYAEVDYQRLGTKLINGRRIIKRFLEKGYTLDLLLRGIDAQVSVEFNAGSGFKAKEEAEAEGQKIKNVLSKRDGGIINDDEAARELGYEKATGFRPGDKAPDGFFGEAKRFVFDRQNNRYEFKQERIEIHALEQPANDRRDQNYQAALESVLAEPEEKAIAAALAAAEAFTDNTRSMMRVIARRFATTVYEAFATTLRSEIRKSAVSRVITRFMSDEWKHWRYEDKSHLQSARVRPEPLQRRATLEGIDIGLVDKNALSYITKIEQFYFGQGNYLANHETTGRQFITWLQDEYIAKGLNIKDVETMKEFAREFSDLVRVTSYQKTVQLVSTTMGRIQNMGQTLSIYEAGFKRYQIVGPKTPPACKHCINMVGRVFEVKVAAKRLAQILDKGFEKTEDLPPFLTSKYTSDALKELSDEELQAAGFETPPFHPVCRHRKAALD
jgi:hypothetical protein